MGRKITFPEMQGGAGAVLLGVGLLAAKVVMQVGKAGCSEKAKNGQGQGCDLKGGGTAREAVKATSYLSKVTTERVGGGAKVEAAGLECLMGGLKMGWQPAG